MPSPFPGMDPYLEDPAAWPNLHLDLIAEIKARLNQSLRPKYIARAEERVYVCDEDDPTRDVIIPDVRIAVRPDREDTILRAPERKTVVATVEPMVCTTLLVEEIHERRIEIIDRDSRRVVTVIEILSPTNKVGGIGQESFREKRLEVMTSPSHWVEIDLLRAGHRALAKAVAENADYCVHVSKVDQRPRGTVWQIALPQRLPTVPIPLRAEDSDFALDLQQVLDAVYDRNNYDLEIDYRAEPTVALTPEQAAWADALLRDKSLRSK